MTQQPRRDEEELVEEIKDKVVNQLYAVLEYVEEAEDDDHRHRQLEIWADWIIEGISQAIERGDILLTKVPPELPGEVSRWDLSDTWQSGDWLRWAYEQLDARTFIALSPAERKEEEE